jgi:hypothetical protein
MKTKRVIIHDTDRKIVASLSFPYAHIREAVLLSMGYLPFSDSGTTVWKHCYTGHVAYLFDSP